MRIGDDYHKGYEIGLFAMRDGDLQPLDTIESECARRMLFHPSGRFLYVSHAGYRWGDPPESLFVYSIDAQGHLEFVETVENGGGAMAVTTPPQVRASTGPGTD
jgi:6-phosphogluconolactonase (cycloisomerase 2 family)